MGRIDPTNTNPDADIVTGFPEHGDPMYTPEPAPAPTAPVPAPTPNPMDEIKALRDRLDRTETELANVRRAPPVAPKEPKPQGVEDVDWDAEFFASPRKALQRHAEMVEKRVAEKLTSQYQRDRSTQAFWESFYEKHPDLKIDHDLVDLTLKSNLAEMSAMPVDKATDRLADLTRERILRYAGDGKSKAPKAKVEGAGTGGGGGAKPPTPKQEDKILSISDMIRKRKDSRRRAAGA